MRVRRMAVAMAGVVAAVTMAGGGDVASGQAPQPIAPQWVQASSPSGGVGLAVTLRDGTVFALSGDATLAARYQPRTDTWTATAPLPTPRPGARAVGLGDEHDRVLVVGDYGSSPLAAVYDPTTDSWSTLAGSEDLKIGVSTVLPDGRIFVSRASQTEWAGRAAIYDPATHTSTTVAPEPAASVGEVAVTLADGRVLAFAGSGWSNTFRIYDPATDSWAVRFGPSRFPEQSTGTVLADGRVLLAGGYATAYVLDPVSWQFTATQPMAEMRDGHAAVRLADGRVLVAGGFGYYGVGQLRSTEFYDPATNGWTSGPSTTNGHYPASMSRLADGRVLLAGAGSAELYTTADVMPPRVIGYANGGVIYAQWNGWFAAPGRVTWTAVDPAPSSAAPTQPAETVLPASVEGSGIVIVSEPSCDPVGNCATGREVMNIDGSAPVIDLGSDRSVYDIDQTVVVRCNVSDRYSGVAQSSCYSGTSMGYQWDMGLITLQGSAVDRVGNASSASASFTVSPTLRGLCAVTKLLAPSDASSLCVKLSSGSLKAYFNEVEARRGKTISHDDANTLESWAFRMM